MAWRERFPASSSAAGRFPFEAGRGRCSLCCCAPCLGHSRLGAACGSARARGGSLWCLWPAAPFCGSWGGPQRRAGRGAVRLLCPPGGGGRPGPAGKIEVYFSAKVWYTKITYHGFMRILRLNKQDTAGIEERQAAERPPLFPARQGRNGRGPGPPWFRAPLLRWSLHTICMDSE